MGIQTATASSLFHIHLFACVPRMAIPTSNMHDPLVQGPKTTSVLPCLFIYIPEGGNQVFRFILSGQAPEVVCFWPVSG